MPRRTPSETRGGARAAAGQVAGGRCAVRNPSLASNPAKPGTMLAEWLKLLRAAWASRQVAGLRYTRVRAWGNLRIAAGAAEWGRKPGRRRPAPQKRPAQPTLHRSGHIDYHKAAKTHDLRLITPAVRISAVNRHVPVRCPITRQQIQALTCPATRRSRRPRVPGMRNAGPAVAYGNRAAAVIVRVDSYPTSAGRSRAGPCVLAGLRSTFRPCTAWTR